MYRIYYKLTGRMCWDLVPILCLRRQEPGKGGTPFTDARKSARRLHVGVTGGLTKAASIIGVGS